MRSHVTAIGLALAIALPAAAQEAGGDGVRLQLDRELSEASLDGGPDRPTFARGERVTGRTGRETTLEGDAELRRGGTVIRGDRLTYYETDDEVIAVGNVRIFRDGQIFSGSQLQLRLDSGVGSFASPRFELPATGGRGSAQRVDFLGGDRVALSDAAYTTCRPEDPDWYLKAGSLTIDQANEEGVGESARLYFKDVPILAVPWFAFPLGNERRSGFLPPSVSLTSTTGAEVRVPYYWNIAPNRDATLQPMIMARRGLQLGALGRWLEPTYSGEATAEYMANDRLSGRDRWLLDTSQSFSNWNGWGGAWRWRGVSDDDYFVDFSRTITASAERSLPRQAIAARSFGAWSFTAQVLKYQNILDARLSPPFDRLPHLSLSRLERDRMGFDLGLQSEATWFSRDLAGSAEGARVVAVPSVSLPIVRPGWFVVPRASLHATAYRLDVNPVGPADIDRTVPTLSIDSGLVMERSLRLGGRELTQTLEPRLFYVYTPYRNQDSIPVFDSAPTTVNFATLFAERLFAGHDRIANTNQLTPGVVSRLIDPQTGAEALRVGIAQRLYFEEQRVTLPGVATRTDRRSDILLAASGELGGGHSVDAGVQLSLRDSRVPQLDLAWHWWPSQLRVFNLAARYRRLDYAQVDASWRWPVSDRWATLGRLNYSVLRHQLDAATGLVKTVAPTLLEAVAGFEYSADCWTLRFVAQRFVTAQSQRTSSFFIQLELSGLGRVGLSPLDILMRNIPGYRVPDNRPSPPSRFFGYQ